MVTSLYEWKMLEWNDKSKTKEQREHCLNYGFLVNLHVLLDQVLLKVVNFVVDVDVNVYFTSEFTCA